MKYFKKIVGERLYLSPVNPEDVLLYCKWLNDFSTADGLNKSKDMITTANEIEYLTEVSKKGQYQFAIVNSKDDTLMGNCGFNMIDNINQNGEAVFPYTFGKLEIMAVDKGDLKAGDIVNYTYYGAIIEKDKVMAADYGDGFLEDLEDLQSDKTYLYIHNAGVIDLEVGQTYLLYMNEPSTKSPRIDAYDISFMRYPYE